jgi:hypothetical protein
VPTTGAPGSASCRSSGRIHRSRPHSRTTACTTPTELAQGPGVKAVGVEGDEPGWVTADYRAGDVLLFHSLTVHAGKQNHADALRLSADFRYQSVHEPVVPASLGPHYHPRIPGWDELTDGWSATWSVGHPDAVRTTDFHDMMDEALVPPPPRLIEVAS